MKKLLVVFVSLAILLNLFGCDSDMRTKEQEKALTYAETEKLISDISSLTEESIDKTDFAMGAGLMFDMDISLGAKNISVTANGDLKAKINYTAPAAAEIIAKLDASLPDLDITSGGENEESFIELYYKDNVAYINDCGDKKKQLLPFAMIFGTESLDDIFSNFTNIAEKYLEKYEEKLPFDITSLDFSRQGVADLLRELFPEKAITDIICDVIEKDFTDDDFKKENFITVKAKTGKVTISLNYENIKSLLEKLFDKLGKRANDMLTLSLNIENLAENDFVYKIIWSGFAGSYLNSIDVDGYKEMFDVLFPDGVTDEDFLKLIEIDTLFESEYSTLEEAATAFSSGLNTENISVYLDWLYANKKEEIAVLVKNYYLKTDVETYFSNADDFTELFEALFPNGVEDSSFANFIALNETVFVNAPYQTLTAAAADFLNAVDKTVFIDWIIENKAEAISDIITLTDYLSEVIEEDITAKITELNGLLLALERIIPSKFDCSVEIGYTANASFTEGYITSFGLSVDLQMEIPTDIKTLTYENLSVVLNSKLELEFDRSKISITAPSDLSEYNLLTK